MAERKWSKIRAGDVVEMGGRGWTVEKIKPKGKKLRVSVRSGSRTAESKVDPSDRVTIAESKPKRAASPRVQRKESAPKPDHGAPAEPADGDVWETQQDRIEKGIAKILSARLVGEATDEEAGYYVPPVDLSTIAAHMLIFHGGVPDGMDELEMLERHRAEHGGQVLDAGGGDPHHWHTEHRPTKKRKKK